MLSIWLWGGFGVALGWLALACSDAFPATDQSPAMGSRVAGVMGLSPAPESHFETKTPPSRPGTVFGGIILHSSPVPGAPVCRSALPGERLLDASSALRVRRLHAVEQTVGTAFKKLAQSREGRQRDGIIAALDIADGLPMHAHQLGQTLLRHIGFQARLADMAANQPQNLLICHRP